MIKKFKLRSTLMIDIHCLDPYSVDTVYGQELLVKINYINCFGKLKITYIPIASETDSYLVHNGIIRESSIISHLKSLFLNARKKSKNERLFNKSQKLINQCKKGM